MPTVPSDKLSILLFRWPPILKFLIVLICRKCTNWNSWVSGDTRRPICYPRSISFDHKKVSAQAWFGSNFFMEGKENYYFTEASDERN